MQIFWACQKNSNTTTTSPSGIRNASCLQVDRFLSEEEVIEINFVTKQRAHRYIAAGQEEWLYPEDKMRSRNWRKLGDGYLFMPDPRHIHGGGEMFVKYESGHHDSWNDYGHKPWQHGYEDKARQDHEWETMGKFKAEWAATYGPKYRGIVHTFTSEDRPAQTDMGNDYHASECARDKEFLRRIGEKARRRKLKR